MPDPPVAAAGTTGLRARVLTAEDGLQQAVVTIVAGAITAVEVCTSSSVRHRDESLLLVDGLLVPGLIDLHCHGGGGGDFASSDPTEIRRAAAFHERHGTTTMLASLVSAPVEMLARQLSAIADVVEGGNTNLLGTHLEGPFLSQRHRGAHRPENLKMPDHGAFEHLLAAARGTLRMITLAPELPGANAVIDAALQAGVVVALGHTSATYEQATAAFHRGASVATHLYNGMPPAHHRRPGPVVAALDAGAWLEVIADGHHLHPAVLRTLARTRPDRLVLVTDAISAAGSPPGKVRLGDMDVRVHKGYAELADGSSLAGSMLTLETAVSVAVRAGVPQQVALSAVTTQPAAALGVGSRHGVITPGRAADLVWMSDQFSVRAVMRAGLWTEVASTPPTDTTTAPR